MRNVLYLHGFASSPEGRKATVLKEVLAKEGLTLVAPDLNIPSFRKLDFKAMAGVAIWEAKKRRPAVVVGSSLGALVALAISPAVRASRLVLLAPALGFGARWTETLAPGDPVTFFHHGQDRELTIHRRFFEEMSRVAVDADPPPVAVTVLMGSADESVPFSGVKATWERWERSGRLIPGSRFVAIPDGDHGLVDHLDRIAAEIREAAGP